MPALDASSDSAQRRRATVDVQGTVASFTDLLLAPALVRSLHKAGFWQPSPVQQAAIPLGRFGADLIVQAKSGTGKTVTFGIIVFDAVNAALAGPQALVVEPTREVALQVQRTVTLLCKDSPVQCCAFVGGLPVHADAARLRGACQIVVGTPGRLRALMQDGSLRTDHLRVLVLDEADTLLAGGFVDDIAYVYGALPARKQVLAFSATYTDTLLAQLRQLMNAPQEVLLCPQTVALQGVVQLYAEVSDAGNTVALLCGKEAALMRILSTLTFNQALVFCNLRGWAEALAERLTRSGFPAAFTCGSLLQRRRMSVMDAARAFRVRVLVSTDLNARGLDLPYVNLVVNVDVPANDATYMHRVGRTGRFGTSGVAVSLVAPRELAQLQGIVARAKGGTLLPMPDEVPSSWYAAELPAEQSAALHELHEQGAALRTRHDAARALPKHAVPERAAASSADAVEPSPAAAHAADACQQHLPWPSWQQQQAAYSFWWWAWRRRCEAELRPAPAWATPPTPLL